MEKKEISKERAEAILGVIILEMEKIGQKWGIRLNAKAKETLKEQLWDEIKNSYEIEE